MTELHAMIDIETVGVGKDAPLFEIGMQVFGYDEQLSVAEVDGKLWRVDIMDVMWRTGRCPQQGTLDWWLQQDYDPSSMDDRVTLSDALRGMDALFAEYKIAKVWANSPSFDLIILQGHYEAFGDDPPWTYQQELDFRTIRWLAKERGWKQPDEDSPTHNALADARLQTKLLMEMLSYVRTA